MTRDKLCKPTSRGDTIDVHEISTYLHYSLELASCLFVCSAAGSWECQKPMVSLIALSKLGTKHVNKIAKLRRHSSSTHGCKPVRNSRCYLTCSHTKLRYMFIQLVHTRNTWTYDLPWGWSFPSRDPTPTAPLGTSSMVGVLRCSWRPSESWLQRFHFMQLRLEDPSPIVAASWQWFNPSGQLDCPERAWRLMGTSPRSCGCQNVLGTLAWFVHRIAMQ